MDDSEPLRVSGSSGSKRVSLGFNSECAYDAESKVVPATSFGMREEELMLGKEQLCCNLHQVTCNDCHGLSTGGHGCHL